jgi:hypothetical protein
MLNRQFSEMHESGTFLRVNVSDAGGGRGRSGSGAPALGTTSAGHAYSADPPPMPDAELADLLAR